MKNQALKNKTDFFIFPSSPFHFDGTFHKPSHFPDKLSDWEGGKYWQTIRMGKRLFGLKIENKGETQQPKIKVSVFYDKNISEGEVEKIKQEIIWRFDLSADLKEFNKLANGRMKDHNFVFVSRALNLLPPKKNLKLSKFKISVWNFWPNPRRHRRRNTSELF